MRLCDWFPDVSAADGRYAEGRCHPVTADLLRQGAGPVLRVYGAEGLAKKREARLWLFFATWPPFNHWVCCCLRSTMRRVGKVANGFCEHVCGTRERRKRGFGCAEAGMEKGNFRTLPTNTEEGAAKDESNAEKPLTVVAIPPLLLVLECCLFDGVDYFHLLQKVPLPLVLEWELLSHVLRDGLARSGWWETQFRRWYPATSFRISCCIERQANTERLVSTFIGVQDHDLWRQLFACLLRAEATDRTVWRENIAYDPFPRHAVHAADEFGVDTMHQLLCSTERTLLRAFSWGHNDSATESCFSEFQGSAFHPVVLGGMPKFLARMDSVTESYFDFSEGQNAAPLKGMAVVKCWTVPFQNAALVLFQRREGQGIGMQELVWVKTGVPRSKQTEEQDLRPWTINRNTINCNTSSCNTSDRATLCFNVDGSEDFVVPDRLDGLDVESLSCQIPVLVAATEDGCVAVVLRGRDVLIFDQKKRGSKEKEIRHWRHLLTDQVQEPRESLVITACCFVLDAFFLLATNDGVLRARPRSNPRSEYHVESMNSLVPHMVSLFNVVAFIHSYFVLEVRLVSRTEDDPFLRFTLLYECKSVDCEHAPLLYGPYVIFAGLDGCWYRVKYDVPAEERRRAAPQKELIKIPGHAGWKILSVKMANWRYLTVVAQDPASKEVSELFLFGDDGCAYA